MNQLQSRTQHKRNQQRIKNVAYVLLFTFFYVSLALYAIHTVVKICNNNRLQKVRST